VYENIETFLDQYPRKIVTFCVANNGVSKMTLNLIKSCIKVNEPIVVFSIDKKITKYLSNYCDVVNYYTGKKSSSAYQYESDDFKEVAWYRYFIINKILERKKLIIYIDVDIVINKPFSKYISKELKSCECVIQTNGRNCCTGFFAIRSTENTRGYFSESNMQKKNYLSYLDQDFFNEQIYNRKRFDIKLLERSLFPNGRFYYENATNVSDKCILIHFNCIVGYHLKINKMKYYNKWNI